MIRRRFGLGRLCSGCRVATRVPYSGRSCCFGRRIHRLTLHLGDLAHGLLHTGLHFSDLAVYDVEILGAVTDPNTRRKGVQYSFTTEISQLGKTPSSTLVDFAVITPSPKIVTLMGLEPGVKVYRFTRVRNVDGEPLILETSYYPEYIYPNLTRELLETHSFYSLLYHVGVIPFSASDTYEAVVLAPHEAQLLHCAPGSAAFFHQRRTTTENGHTYEYTTSYMRADRVKLDVRFQKGSTSFMRTVD